MALAKYCEDIIDRYSEDNYERINALFSGRDFAKEWRELARVDSAAVAAQYNGRFFEDRMVFLQSSRVRFSVKCASNTQPVVARFTRRSAVPEVLLPDEGGRYEIRVPKEDGELQLQCGFYSKTYRLSFLDKTKPENLPDVQPALAALVTNPARWTSAGFEKLRTELENALAVPGVPADFATGVKEFYLGLFHESVGEINFRKRIETAFNVLRPFCPYSGYATLICAYYLYRVNCFEQVASLAEIPALSRLAEFFMEAPALNGTPKVVEQATATGTEILVSDRDHALFGAVTHFLAGDLSRCSEQIEVASRASNHGLDTQGDERIALVRARLATRCNKMPEAARLYGTLANSPTEAFRAEANAILKSQPTRK
ncbi:MAG TPA: hypothetical protein VGF13_10535 [Verrucomicrobiae bacterium]|jgi:hypothetical protein